MNHRPAPLRSFTMLDAGRAAHVGSYLYPRCIEQPVELTTADSHEIANSTPPTLLLARRFTMRALPSLYIAGLLAILSIACSSDASRLSSPAHRSSPDVSSASATPAPDQQLSETADLVITKVADRKNVHIGENISFTITVTNLGPAAAAGGV